MADPVPPVDPAVNDDDPIEVGTKIREPTDYEKRLRRENAKWRTDYRAASEALEATKKAHDSDIAAIRAQVQAEADKRVVLAEVKAAALKAGMVDLDGLKLLDLSAVKLLENGNVEGADAVLAAAKTAKPYLFGTSTAKPGDPPPPKDPAVKKAADMTPAEYAAAKRALGIR